MEAENQIRFEGFTAGATMCHFGGRGGMPSSSLVFLSDGGGPPTGIIIPAGGINNSTLRYITPDGKVYEGTYKNSGENTNLTLQ